MNHLVDAAVPYFIRRMLPSIADGGRALFSSDVTHVVSALTGKPVDILYSRLTGISCLFFSKGWGDLRVVDLAEDLKYLHTEWPTLRLKIDWKLKSEGYQDRKPFKVYEGKFRTPCVKRIWDALPSESRQGVVQLLVPSSGICRSGVVHLAATGDQGFTRRAKLAAPLLSQGVAGLILESPFYGCRKPPHQFSSKLDHVSDLLTLGWATIFESMQLLRWLQQEGYEQTGLSGTSMGGVHACLATSLYPEPVACVPFLAPRSAAVAYCEGAMWPVTAWQALQKDVDDRNNDLMSVLEDATQAHECGVRLRQARVSPRELATPSVPYRALSSSPDLVAGPAEARNETGALPGIDRWLTGLLPMPSVSLDPSWLKNPASSWIAFSPTSSQPLNTSSATRPCNSGDDPADGHAAAAASADDHATFMHGMGPKSLGPQDEADLHPETHSPKNVNSGQDESGGVAGVRHAVYQPVQVFSDYPPSEEAYWVREQVEGDAWNCRYDEQWELKYGRQDPSTQRSHSGSSYSLPQEVRGEERKNMGQRQLQPGNVQQQAAALRELIDGCDARATSPRASRAWSDMQSTPQAHDVMQLQRHLSLMKLRAVLETFTDITRFPVPRQPNAAILIAAKDDAYVNKESVHEVHQYWKGSELRIVPGGHVSAFLTQQAALREALVDALGKLNQP